MYYFRFGRTAAHCVCVAHERNVSIGLHHLSVREFGSVNRIACSSLEFRSEQNVTRPHSKHCDEIVLFARERSQCDLIHLHKSKLKPNQTESTVVHITIIGVVLLL